MLWFNEQWVYFNEKNYEDKGNVSRGSISSSETDRDGNKKYSRFFCTFFGSAHEKIRANINVKSFKIKKAGITNSSYKNADGNEVFPKYPTVNIYEVSDITYRDDPVTAPFSVPDLQDDGSEIPF